MKKTTISFVAGVTALVVGMQSVHAQSIPPACQQYITAFKVCGEAYIHLTELSQPAQTPTARTQIDTALKSVNSQLQEAVRQNGAQAVAERCAAPPFKTQMLQGITGIMTLLGFGNGMTEECQDAYSAIR
jgi:hypothetical protein